MAEPRESANLNPESDSAASASSPAAGPASAARPPSVRRRLAALLYEALLLFGVVFVAAYLFSTLTQQRNGLTHHNLLAAWIGLVVGLYFVWFWTHSGQTLPMKTWRLRVVTAEGAPLSAWRAIARYVLAWLWFLPPLALHPLLGLHLPQTLALAGLWFVLWAATGRLGASRQFLHDRLAGTRVIDVAR
ncbi:RDD family protein [Burkholderia sp. WSM2232]|uniref:RDD family protein n=1 Tax=Burkholderia sp. WSM2232 TaxID=944436 RepID=UPI0004002D25|nr:RDD family protein [Burkholderia sp. WSM2232]